MPWDAEAMALLDDAIERHPVVTRISAAKHLRDAAERAARAAGEQEVGIERVKAVIGPKARVQLA